jgi:hypothetical protein
MAKKEGELVLERAKKLIPPPETIPQIAPTISKITK